MVVKELTTRDVVSVTPDTTLKDVASTLVREGISGAPVCDTDGRVVGVVSEGDILFKTSGPRESRGTLARLALEGRRSRGEGIGDDGRRGDDPDRRSRSRRARPSTRLPGS